MPFASFCAAEIQPSIQSPRRRGRAAKGDGEAERFGGLEIDDQFDLGSLIDWQVGRLFALENSTGINARQTERSVVLPRSSSGRRPWRMHETGRSWAPRSGSPAPRAFAAADEEAISGDDKPADAQLG